MKRLTTLGFVAFVGLLLAPVAGIGDPAGPPGGLDVKVLNTPLPVTGNVNANVTGSVNVNNTPLPVTGNVNATVTGNVNANVTGSVNVTNIPLPVTGNVNVVNLADSPLWVTSDTPIPFSGDVYFDNPSPFCEDFDLSYGLGLNLEHSDRVPFGSIAVVKHISCRAEFKGTSTTEPSEFFQRPPEVWDTRGGSIRSEQYLPFPTRGPVFKGFSDSLLTRIDSFSAALELYVAPDADICAYLPANFATARCHITGYLRKIP